MKRIFKILIGLLVWTTGVSMIGTSGMELLFKLSGLLKGMPTLFIIDAHYILIVLLSSILTASIMFWVFNLRFKDVLGGQNE